MLRGGLRLVHNLGPVALRLLNPVQELGPEIVPHRVVRMVPHQIVQLIRIRLQVIEEIVGIDLGVG